MSRLHRWSGEQHDLMLALTADLVRRKVAVIYTASGVVSQAAKAATTSIPIVFTTGGDPIRLGLVRSLNRPGGNVSGITFFSNVLAAKRLTLLLQFSQSDPVQLGLVASMSRTRGFRALIGPRRPLVPKLGRLMIFLWLCYC
jgi:putative ABC transport system substrate-binding protein